MLLMERVQMKLQLCYHYYYAVPDNDIVGDGGVTVEDKNDGYAVKQQGESQHWKAGSKDEEGEGLVDQIHSLYVKLQNLQIQGGIWEI